MAIKFLFLGTGTSQGVPVLLSKGAVNFSKDPKDKRLRSSVLVRYKAKNYLIDCGLDFRQQMIRSNTQSIAAIFFTHEHADHIGGLDDIRPFCYKYGAMHIYARDRVIRSLEQRYPYIFATQNRYLGAPSVQDHLIFPYQKYEFGSLVITPLEFLHGKNLPILGYLFEDENNKMAYLTDVKYYDEKSVAYLKNLDVLVVNALRMEPHDTHFNLEEALAFINTLQPKKTYLTHISHLLGFHKEVQNRLPKNVFLAYDGLEVRA